MLGLFKLSLQTRLQLSQLIYIWASSTAFMSEESFLLVSLEEDKAKKLAQVISNDTSRLILDHLSKKADSTETAIAESLNIPLSTVHYNLKQLVAAKLVAADTYHYSEKGKEVLHYHLSNKYVIIAPKSSFSLREKLKQILPVAAIVGAASVVLDLASKAQPVAERGMLMKSMADYAAEESAGALMAPTAAALPQAGNSGLWFFIGGLAALVLLLLWSMIFRKK